MSARCSRPVSFEGGQPWRISQKRSSSTEIAALLPRRMHEVMDRFVQDSPDHIALVEDGSAWSYRELDKHVGELARQLASLGVRAGDRMMIVSENCIALAALLFAASRLDAWAIVANPAPVGARDRPNSRPQRRTPALLHDRLFRKKRLRMPRVLMQRSGSSAHSGRSASAGQRRHDRRAGRGRSRQSRSPC